MDLKCKPITFTLNLKKKALINAIGVLHRKLERRMMLIRCSECKKEVSDKAPNCLNCGAPLSQKVQQSHGGAFNADDPVHLIGCAFAILILVGSIVMGLRGFNFLNY